ncbi:TetR/AcrR family transcriptional regulator [Leucobacter chromiiresistens]
MARTAGFDRRAVVRAAMDVFWSVGYEGAAISDLEQATGLRRSSIYNSFGSKRGLFDAAVEQYLDTVIRPRVRPLHDDDVAPDAVVVYLEGLRAALADPASHSARSGCLLINTAGSPIGHDAAVAATVAAYRSELRAALGRGVAARLPHLDQRDADRLADACTGQVIAALALARIDGASAVAAIDTALALIRAA